MLILSFLIVLLAVFLVIEKKQHKGTVTREIVSDPDEACCEPAPAIIGEYAGKYQRKYLLTKNEWHEYRKLKAYAEAKGLQICPKVRLLDLIEPIRGDPKYKTYFYKIQAKHVDFVICDADLYVKAILELDDNSHKQTERRERDEFVDLILMDVGYKVIRVNSVTEKTLDGV